MALTLTSVVISGLNVITASILITVIVSKKTYQLESTCVLSWVVVNKLVLLLIFTISVFGLKFIWLLLVMLKGVEGKKGKGKAPHGRGCGSTRDDDDGSPGGGSGHGWGLGRGHQVIHLQNLRKWAVLPRASHDRSGQCRGCKVPLICTKGGKVYFLI